eukprot:6210792-Pleurochrysis_carterae.AAC.5
MSSFCGHSDTAELVSMLLILALDLIGFRDGEAALPLGFAVRLLFTLLVWVRRGLDATSVVPAALRSTTRGCEAFELIGDLAAADPAAFPVMLRLACMPLFSRYLEASLSLRYAHYATTQATAAARGLCIISTRHACYMIIIILSIIRAHADVK